MIRSHFGLQRNPFDTESISLLAQQQEIFDILRVHAQQGGLCLVLGEPGTGKSVLKQALVQHDPKRMITPWSIAPCTPTTTPYASFAPPSRSSSKGATITVNGCSCRKPFASIAP